MIKEKVIKTINEHNLLNNYQHIVVGLSGGPDSVCLFHILLNLREKMNLNIYPVHINHKFRPGAAEEDQLYVEKLCRENHCTCRIFEIDCNLLARQKKISSEEAGRIARYRAFAEVADELREKGIANKDIRIAIAQNADDQAETILFRMLRGTGTDGLAGIRYSRNDEYGNTIIRPLLDIKRKEIEAYCEENNLFPRIDKTNLEPLYTRNRIRLQLLPYLEEEYNSGIKDTLIRMGKNVGCDSEFLWNEAEKAYIEIVKEQKSNMILFDGEKLRNLHRAVRQRVLSRGLADIGFTEDIGAVHFDGCEKIVYNEKSSARTDLPKGVYFAKLYDDFKLAVDDGKEKKIENICISVLNRADYEMEEKYAGCYAAFDYDRLVAAYGEGFEKDVILRARKAGDYLAISEEHTKKLQNYFVDMKIPKDERDEVFLLTFGHEILWILPHGNKGRFSAKYKLCGDTKKVFFIEIVRTI